MRKIILGLIVFFCVSMAICDWQAYMMIGYDHGYKDALISLHRDCDGCFAIDSAMIQFQKDSTAFRASFLGGF